MNDAQQRTFKHLKSVDTRLAGMYQACLDMLDEPSYGGDSLTRASLMAHSMREVMTGLPDALNSSATERPNPSSSALLKKIVQLFNTKFPGLDLQEDGENIPVPVELARTLDGLISAANAEFRRNQDRTAELLTDDANSDHPVIQQWSGAYRFFMSWTHLDRSAGSGRTVPLDEEFMENIKVIEDVVDLNMTGFFANRAVVDEILSKANLRSGDNADG